MVCMCTFCICSKLTIWNHNSLESCQINTKPRNAQMLRNRKNAIFNGIFDFRYVLQAPHIPKSKLTNKCLYAIAHTKAINVGDIQFGIVRMSPHKAQINMPTDILLQHTRNRTYFHNNCWIARYHWSTHSARSRVCVSERRKKTHFQ